MVNFDKVYPMIFKTILLTLLLLHSLQAITLKNEIINSKPWGYLDKNGAIQGVLAEYANALGELSNIEITNRLSPYGRVWRNLDSGKSDISILIRSKERKNSVVYVAKVTSFNTVILGREGLSLKNYKDLKGKTVGVLIGSKMSKKFDEDQSIIKRYLRSYEIMLKMLKEKRVDAILGLESSLYYLGKTMNLSNILGDEIVLENKEIWLHLSKANSSEALIKTLKRSVDTLNQNHFLEKLLQRSIGSDWKESH